MLTKNDNFYLYVSRAISALCLFVILAEANVWLDTVNNTVLVLGYRLFIIFTPFIFLLFKHKVSIIAFIIAEIGLIFWLLHLHLIGTLLIAIGLSISGYMLKYYAALTAQGAAGNKIALNLGSVFSGLTLILFHNQIVIIVICSGLIILSLVTFIRYYRHQNIKNYGVKKDDFTLSKLLSKKGIAWALVGFVIGVKLIAIFTILPQFLLQQSHRLPSWYGSMLIINCVIILLLQMPVMNIIQKWNVYKALAPLLVSAVIVLASPFFHLTSIIGATVWIVLLSIIECTISYLDKLARDDGYLLIKEAAVGIGSAVTVLGVRGLSPVSGSLLVGTGALALVLLSGFLIWISIKSNND